jgi:hypothetical protein
LHYIQPSIDVGFKILVGAPLFCPLDGQTKGGVVVGTTGLRKTQQEKNKRTNKEKSKNNTNDKNSQFVPSKVANSVEGKYLLWIGETSLGSES